MAGGIGTGDRMRAEFVASLVILLLVAVLPAFVTNAYWLGVIIVSMYFA
jgi:branched-chain amino acid transport system permease protein